MSWLRHHGNGNGDGYTAGQLAQISLQVNELSNRMQRVESTGSPQLQDHVRECERRYRALEEKMDEQHLDNKVQIRMVERTLNRMYYAGLTGTAGIVGILLESLVRIWLHIQ